MNRTRIEWVKNPDGTQGYSWNPIKGLCPNACFYCYARKMYKRFHWDIKPRFVEEDWRDVYDPSFDERGFFVCSTFDLFHPITKTLLFGSKKITWRGLILGAIEDLPNHRFYILTKFPQNIHRKMPDNVWLGTSITKPIEMYPRIKSLYKATAKLKFVSFEPLMGDVGQFRFQGWLGQKVDWIIVGRLTGHGHKYDPKDYWITSLVYHAKKFNTPIFLKNNLKEIYKEPLIQEFPEEG